jgi:prolipoprotein diacylglyceryltransferase
MHPVLFEIPLMEFLSWVIGPIPIKLYCLMNGLGFVLGIFLARQAKKEGVNLDRILDLGFHVPLAGYRGFLSLFVLTNLGKFSVKPFHASAIWKRGLGF